MSQVVTVGQLMVDAALPKGLRGDRVLDKKGLFGVLKELAQNHPDKYREATFKLMQVAKHAAYTTGGYSFGPEHMLPPPGVVKLRKKLQTQLQGIMDNDDLSEEDRNNRILRAVSRAQAEQEKLVYDESVAEDNPLANQVVSGSRGSPLNLTSLRGSDMLYMDHRDRVIPLPVLRSYAQGLSPAEYWAGTYGARKGTMDTKFATQDAGFLSKQLNQIVHRSLVTALDADKDSDTLRGMPVNTDDDESEGALLARDVLNFKRNTVVTPKLLSALRQKGVKRMLIRSPISSGSPDGGVYARDAGVREFNRLPVRGENVGLAAAQALSEPISQGGLSSRHSGGVATAKAGKIVSGFDRINQLIQSPKVYKGGAAHATVDGSVSKVEEAPAGGQFVTIDGTRHYVAAGFKVKVKRGDKVEAGDILSDGLPNPAMVVQHKGVGEGRRYFVDVFRQALRDAGMKGHRRNIELLARGLINHVRLTDEMGDYGPDDVVPYSVLEASYKPRPETRQVTAKQAVGKYLEQPYLHYSIGTKVRPSMLQDFNEFGVADLQVHDEPPHFQPEMVRGMSNLQHDPDWMARLFGSGQKTSLLNAVHMGGTSDEKGTSFVPGLARAVDFGKVGPVVTPKPPKRQGFGGLL